MSLKLVILDRDGVINQDSADFIKKPEEFLPLQGSLEAISRLNQAGILVAVATNQSGLARKYFSEATLKNIHQYLQELLKQHGGHIDAIYYCPHGPDDNCKCRKPKPGLIEDILAHFKLQEHLDKVVIIGDSWRDIEAARAAGCEALLVKTGNGAKTAQLHAHEFRTEEIFFDLAHAVETLLRINP